MTRRIRGWVGALESADRGLLASVAVLLFFGTIVIFGVGSYARHGSSSSIGAYSMILRHLVMIAVGVGVMFTLMHLDYRLFRARWLNLSLLVVTYAMVGATLLIGRFDASGEAEINRWISIGGFTFQPIEMAKIAMIVFLADRLTRRRQGSRLPGRQVLLALAVGPLPLLVLLGLQPNYSNLMVTLGLTLVILFVTEVSDRWLLRVLVLVPVMSVLGFFFQPKIHRRVLDTWNGMHDGAFCYQVNQSLYGMGAGGLTGLGPGQSQNKFDFLPEAHTDFVFSVLGEEWGLLGTLLVICMFVLFAWRGYSIAGRAREPYGRALAVGLTSGVVIYGVANMAMVTGIFPVVGLPLPFVSYGGTAMVTAFATVGVLLSIERSGRSQQQWREPISRGGLA